MSDMNTAEGRVHFNEFGDYLDQPYVVRALRSFDVNLSDGDGGFVEGELFHVEEGSVWEVYEPGDENDVHLDGNDGWLDLNWDDLRMFELLEEGGYSE